MISDLEGVSDVGHFDVFVLLISHHWLQDDGADGRVQGLFEQLLVGRFHTENGKNRSTLYRKKPKNDLLSLKTSLLFGWWHEERVDETLSGREHLEHTSRLLLEFVDELAKSDGSGDLDAVPQGELLVEVLLFGRGDGFGRREEGH